MLLLPPLSTLFPYTTLFRSHIGESLIPETYWVLQRLNMLDQMQQSRFVKKYSVQFVNAHGKESADRKSTRLNSSHGYISYAVFCLKKKKNIKATKIANTLKI